MIKNDKLTNEERIFCSLISKASFINPFSDDRSKLDALIACVPEKTPPEKRLHKLKEQLAKRIKNFENQKKANINLYEGTDSLLARDTLLFSIFHLYIDDFDQLILQQLKAPETPCNVPFAKDAFALFKKYGFTIEDSCKYFAIFYQMRRAYYFIEKGLSGNSPCMKTLRLNLWNNVFTYDLDLYDRYLLNRMEDFSTLLLGETGTGKGTAAIAIGRSGFIPFDKANLCFKESFTESFVSLNISQYPESLIESELFGHKKGAFTGAVEEHKGIFNRCSPHGSIFLDEIGEVSIPVQIKLLQILQERIFSPVGSHQKIRFHGRVIAATNRDINTLRINGEFRDDFFYRLCSDILTIPPLRQRIQEDSAELDILLSHTLTKMLGKPSEELVEIIKKSIHANLGKQYHWPGNVRELEQCVRRILLNRTYLGDTKITNKDTKEQFMQNIKKGNLDAESLLKNYCEILYEKYGTYEEVARKTNLDRRTVKKYLFK